MDVRIVMSERLVNKFGLPAYETLGSAGMDIRADKTMHVGPGDVVAIPTGIRLGIPEGWEMQVRSRSGLALKHGLVVMNSPGTIDSDYRGEVMVLLYNSRDEGYTVWAGDRIAQMVLAPVHRVNWVPTEMLDQTERGEGGLGSTGNK